MAPCLPKPQLHRSTARCGAAVLAQTRKLPMEITH
jgi:hypothetical protein